MKTLLLSKSIVAGETSILFQIVRGEADEAAYVREYTMRGWTVRTCK